MPAYITPNTLSINIVTTPGFPAQSHKLSLRRPSSLCQGTLSRTFGLLVSRKTDAHAHMDCQLDIAQIVSSATKGDPRRPLCIVWRSNLLLGHVVVHADSFFK